MINDPKPGQAPTTSEQREVFEFKEGDMVRLKNCAQLLKENEAAGEEVDFVHTLARQLGQDPTKVMAVNPGGFIYVITQRPEELPDTVRERFPSGWGHNVSGDLFELAGEAAQQPIAPEQQEVAEFKEGQIVRLKNYDQLIEENRQAGREVDFLHTLARQLGNKPTKVMAVNPGGFIYVTTQRPEDLPDDVRKSFPMGWGNNVGANLFEAVSETEQEPPVTE